MSESTLTLGYVAQPGTFQAGMLLQLNQGGIIPKTRLYEVRDVTPCTFTVVPVPWRRRVGLAIKGAWRGLCSFMSDVVHEARYG